MPVAGAGFVTVIVPVATVQPGWATVTVGCVRAGGGTLIVTLRGGDTQPALFFTVTL